jgi:class 3 adenylate cyclase/tetratricopeptide (TPR) repeat protein
VAICPRCGRENPEGFQFCGFCTAPLVEQPAAAGQEERKVVSVLFCDLVGFTAASDAADPEDVRARIRPYHARLREMIERHGGTVEKFVGDAVMAVFGAPVAHEDDAERAVRAGLRILEAIDELNAQDASLSLQVRVGINTGEAVVALGARPEEGEGIVTGDVVNTASRLQGAAPVNAVAVSEQTYRVTEPVFDYEPLEPVTVKGKAEPLALYRPLAARARFGSEVTRTHATPLVGRDLERTLLMSTFERAAQQQSCQLVTVVGEPGVGKSRLCMELFQHIEERPGLVRWRQGRCLPYGEGIAFWALGEIVKAECGILESDPPDEVRAKLERAVAVDAQDRPWLLARLGPLVGLTGEPAAQEESFTAWRRFLEQLAGDRPAVLVFEDLHWADPALLAFLQHLADWAEGVPLLVLCTARPELHEQHATWAAGLRNAHTINLAPLTDEETARLVSSLLERAVLPAETQHALLERAGGNPLYAEEFVRLLTDRGALGAETALPESVQALIAARLDTLSHERKSLLQDASVLGKVFWAGALAVMGDRDASEVERALHELARKELVRPARTSSMAGEAEYGFWHSLVRDVAYGQIPRAGRAERHQRAAAWIEQKTGERAEDLADVLAHHYLSALELTRATGRTVRTELREQAVRYLALAGERALGLDTEQAERNLNRALELADDEDPQRPQLLERWAKAAQQQGRLREARDALEQALTLHRQAGDKVAAGRALTQLSLVLRRLGDPRQAETLTEALGLLEAEPPGAELVGAYSSQAAMCWLGGAFEEAVAAADNALNLAARLDHARPASALGYRGAARASQGDPQGKEEMRKALSLALEQDEGRSAAVLYNNLAFLTWLHEGPAASLEIGREGIEFSQRRGLAEVAEMMAGGQTPAIADLGRIEEALTDAGRLADELEEAGDLNFVETRSLQLHLLAERGQHEQAPDPGPMLKAARDSGQPQAVALAVSAATKLLHAQGCPDHAHLLLHELDQMAGTRTEPAYASVLVSLVRTALALGDPDLATSLTEGVPLLLPLHQHALTASQAQLAEAAGNHSHAASLYNEAGQRWHQFGNVPERAYALLGQGRCLTTLANPDAEQPLRQTRELFKSMGYKPALAETEALLQQAEAAATS